MTTKPTEPTTTTATPTTDAPDPAVPVDPVLAERVEQLVDFIMKKCLWQFHSRAWDRSRQNEAILTMTSKLLCGEPVDATSPFDRCYYVDAVHLAENFSARYPWVDGLPVPQKQEVMRALLARIEFLTVTGSLNAELTDAHY